MEYRFSNLKFGRRIVTSLSINCGYGYENTLLAECRAHHAACVGVDGIVALLYERNCLDVGVAAYLCAYLWRGVAPWATYGQKATREEPRSRCLRI